MIFKSISVYKNSESIEVYNPTDFLLIKIEENGAVFQLSENLCVKIYAEQKELAMEKKGLQAIQHLSFIPKICEVGDNYIMMEYIEGPTLKEYLQNRFYMPEPMTRKLLNIINELNHIHVTLQEDPLSHIFVQQNEELKVGGPLTICRNDHLLPIKLCRGLKEIGLLGSFLLQVEYLDKDAFDKWKSYLNAPQGDFREIKVYPGEKKVIVENDLHFPLIGKGHQGAVFRLSEDRCVKIYGRVKYAKREQNVLLSSQNLSFVPKVYEIGPNYVVMEYLTGPSLNTYLKKQTELPEDITRRLLVMLEEMKQGGYTKIDAPLRHIIITVKGFKLVDHVFSFSREQEDPLELFKDLQQLNLLESFLKQVKKLDRKTYKRWKKVIEYSTPSF